MCEVSFLEGSLLIIHEAKNDPAVPLLGIYSMICLQNFLRGILGESGTPFLCIPDVFSHVRGTSINTTLAFLCFLIHSRGETA